MGISEYVCVCVCEHACLLACMHACMHGCEMPNKTVDTRFGEHSKTRTLAWHLGASTGTLQYITIPQTHTLTTI